MSLTAGTKFCPYEIQSPLGAGGTGEAYRRYTQLRQYLAILAAYNKFKLRIDIIIPCGGIEQGIGVPLKAT
jgi:hypothetical protein